MKDYKIFWAGERAEYLKRRKELFEKLYDENWDMEEYIYLPDENEKKIIEKEIKRVSNFIKYVSVQMIQLHKDLKYESSLKIYFNDFDCHIKLWYEPNISKTHFNVDFEDGRKIGIIIFNNIRSVEYQDII